MTKKAFKEMHSLKEMRGKLQCFSKTGIKILPKKRTKNSKNIFRELLAQKSPPVPTSTVTSQCEIAQNLSLLEAKNGSSFIPL